MTASSSVARSTSSATPSTRPRWRSPRQPATAGRVAPGTATPGRATPGPAIPGRAIPGPATAGVGTPGRATPGPATPGVGTPGPATLGAGTPGRATLGQATLGRAGAGTDGPAARLEPRPPPTQPVTSASGSVHPRRHDRKPALGPASRVPACVRSIVC